MAFGVHQYKGEIAVAVGRIASIAMGPLVALAISSRLSPEEQGYYFAFISILGARAAFDAGLAQVIINTAAQAAVRLKIDGKGHIAGPNSDLANVGNVFRFALRWYLYASIAMLIAVGGAGYIFFQQHANSPVDWQGPWVWFIFFSVVDFSFQCLWTITEGMNQIVYVYALRAVKTVTSSSILVILVLWGAGLWSCVGYAALAIIPNIYLLSRRQSMFGALWRARNGELRWQTEIWPFQWKMALSWAGGYLIVPLFVPVTFSVLGPAAAGRVGMTNTILIACMSLAQSVIDAQIPRLCSLVAKRQWRELDQLFFKRLLLSIGIFAAMIIGAFCSILLLNAAGLPFSQRIVPWPDFALFALAFFANHLVNSQASYLRSHRKEPFLWLSISFGTLMIVLSISSVKLFGLSGLSGGYLCASLLYCLPIASIIFFTMRRRWHHPAKGDVHPLKSVPL